MFTFLLRIIFVGTMIIGFMDRFGLMRPDDIAFTVVVYFGFVAIFWTLGGLKLSHTEQEDRKSRKDWIKYI